MNEIEIFKLSVSDFLTKPILKRAFTPFLITLVVLYVLFLAVAGFSLEQLTDAHLHVETHTTTTQNGIPHEEHTEQTFVGSSVLKYLLSFGITSMVLNFFVYTLGSVLTVMLSVFIALIVIGFFTPYILEIIRERHYPHLKLNGYGNMVNMIWILLKSLLVSMPAW